LLTHQGHLVQAVASAEEALRYLVGHPFDAIIMDVHLPGMNGDEAARRIRAMADPAVARLPIVGLTANAFYEERAGYLAAGMDAVLAKPVSPERLLSTIAQVREKVREPTAADHPST
ncbi:MAG: response regulator, partial [Magnetococcales bacterium]|nr:response regulator [Magnetococcales bacterium]